jgi:hypothetical protein
MNFGKGMFLWKLIYCESGNPQAIANAAQSAGLSHVLFKIAQGSYSYNVSADIPAIVSALHSKGIAVWGWHYITLASPLGDGAIAVSQVTKYGLDGYCIDAEGECKNKPTQTTAFMNYLSKNMKVPIALSSYRYPKYHPELSWKMLLSGCNYVMPQVYWMKANNPTEQLIACRNEYDKLQLGFGMLPLPMIPTGAAFCEFEWKPTTEEVKAFMDTAKKLGLSGCNFWEWHQARDINPEFWPVIASYNFGEEPTELTTDQKVEILWGEAAIRGWNLST